MNASVENKFYCGDKTITLELIYVRISSDVNNIQDSSAYNIDIKEQPAFILLSLDFRLSLTLEGFKNSKEGYSYQSFIVTYKNGNFEGNLGFSRRFSLTKGSVKLIKKYLKETLAAQEQYIVEDFLKFLDESRPRIKIVKDNAFIVFDEKAIETFKKKWTLEKR